MVLRVNIFEGAKEVRPDSIAVDIQIMIQENLSPKAQSLFMAQVARGELADAIAINTRALGSVPKYETFVDGRQSAVFENVRPTGSILITFELLQEIMAWIGAELVQHSPVGGPPAPAYASNHKFFADGQQIDPGGPIPPAMIYMFANVVPYARKIERGESAQAVDGVYQAVATLAQAKFGKAAKIRFNYVAIPGLEGERQPAIIITGR